MISSGVRRSLAIVALGLVLAGGDARAQTQNTDEKEWHLFASASAYVLSDSRHYVQPTVSVDRDWLRLEARVNYEGLDTASLWVGYNFGGGQTLAWEVTPMLGGVFGDTTGVASGFKGSLSWRMLELYGESEYVVDTANHSDSFFYNWSELTLSPIEWFRVGLVTQRTHAYESERDVQLGVMAGVAFRRINLTAYVFKPEDDKSRFVFAVGLTLP